MYSVHNEIDKTNMRIVRHSVCEITIRRYAQVHLPATYVSDQRKNGVERDSASGTAIVRYFVSRSYVSYFSLALPVSAVPSAMFSARIRTFSRSVQ